MRTRTKILSRLLGLGCLLILAPQRLDVVLAQGVPRTFSTRPFGGGPLSLAKAVLQGTAELPCDVRPPANDSYILVVWYKQDVSPIFSYDVRGKYAQQASVWSASYLNHRSFFRTHPEPATLNINHVDKSDEGEYRCRVDFMKNPSRNSRVQLSIITPPNKPVIENEMRQKVGSNAGPYKEGGDMMLTCLVTGGDPAPSIKWWRGQELLESRDNPTEFQGVRKTTLVVKGLHRSDLHAEFTCQASNNNISQPVSTTVSIDMYLKPLNATIVTNKEDPLSAGRTYEVNCVTVGSRPAAKLSWYKESHLLTNYTEKISPDGNMTSSTLSFTPTVADNGRKITCRAENPNSAETAEEDSLILNVHYVPKLRLSLGSNMNPKDIEEGDDVYFDCNVTANPGAYKVVWKHNGNVLQNNVKLGMIVQQNSLALRKVSRTQAGNYTCIASNVEGDGASNVVELKIMYKPICLPDQKRIYGVARHEEARVVCRVESYPAPSSFRWAFNSTEELVDVPAARFNYSTSQSVLTYKPTSDMDFGTVLCWAQNNAGQQKNACIFHIIAAGKPEPPYNCTLTNQTTQSLSVECTPGFDGGQSQHFQLEVYDQITGQLRANVSNARSDPGNVIFNVYNLESGRILKMAVYAVNSKGRSESTLLEGFTHKVAEKQTGTPVPFEVTPLLGILIGIVAALLLCTVTVLLALKVRSDRRAPRPGDLPLKKGATAPSSEDLYDPDDRNPDVVPCTNKDSEYQLTAGTPQQLLQQAQQAQDVGTPDGLSSTSLTTTPASNPAQLLGSTTSHLLPSYGDYNNYPTLPLSGEVTYAELCLARPSTLTTAAGTEPKLASIGGLSSLAGFSSNSNGTGNNGGIIVGGSSYAKEPTVYACIDHSARAPPPSPPKTMAPPLPPHPLKQQPREVVTVRTPLISSQESCV